MKQSPCCTSGARHSNITCQAKREPSRIPLSQRHLFQNELVRRRCEIINLNQRKDLIGQTCIVEKFTAKKNWYKVTTEHTHETFLVGRDNLKRRDRTPDDPGYYVTFVDSESTCHCSSCSSRMLRISTRKMGQLFDGRCLK